MFVYVLFFVAKCINFAAENEHNDKGWLDLNNNQ